MPGTIEPGTMPHRPGMSASLWSIGATIMSQVLVPMILTSVPGLMPAPTAPAWASKSPTATGRPGGSPTRSATSAVNRPARRSDVSAGAAKWRRISTRSGSSRARKASSGSPPQSSWYIALWPAAQMPRGNTSGSSCPVMNPGTKSASSTQA